jgi:serine/threonine-protein kinase
MELSQTSDLVGKGTSPAKGETVVGGQRVAAVMIPSVRLSSATSSVPRLYGEIRDLYRRRLLEVGVIGGGTWWFLFAYFVSGVNDLMSPWALGGACLAIFATPVVAFPAAFVWLTLRPGASFVVLRVVEWVLVVTTLLPLLAWRYASVGAALTRPEDARTELVTQFATAYCNFPCTAMIVVYGVFVPNTPRRTVVMLTLMAAAILGADLCAWLPRLSANRSAFVDSMFQTAVMLFLSLGTAFYGSFKVGALQQEALAAREQARQLGQYHLTRLLGAGAMGEVYLAEHRLLKRPCAVKLVRSDRANDPKALIRFEREVRSTARVMHPNIIEIYDFGRTEDGTFYYVMEYLEGLSVDEVVRRHGPLPPGRALHLVRQLCGALRASHAQGLVHRDIKPSNIFLCRRGEMVDVVKLLDFGLVHAMAEGMSDSRLTQDGGIVGTPEYMSPEQADGLSSVDGRSDLYSLGGVLHFMLTGQPPFVRATALQTLIAHRQDNLQPLRDLNCTVSTELEDLLRRCLAKGQDARFADVSQLDAAIRACCESGDWSEELALLWWSSHPDVPLGPPNPPDTASGMTVAGGGPRG